MLLSETGIELIEQLERQRDVPSLLGAFKKLIKAFGMAEFCIGDASHPHVKRPARHWDGSWPMEAYRFYAGLKLFSSDPTVLRINADPAPFRWSDTYAHASIAGKRVLDEMAAFCRDGFAVPIHGPQGAISGVSIGTDHYGLSRQDERALHIASLYLHARMNSLRAPPRRAVLLAPRERECLKWVAAGKTDWEISQILNISEQTAHGYVQNALSKLGARTRAQAVALAIQSSQILP